MRKLAALVLILIMITTVAFPLAAEASTIRVIIDGKEKIFSPSPVLVGGSTIVPMRSFFEALGASVNWDMATRSVTSTKGNTTIKLTIEQSVVT